MRWLVVWFGAILLCVAAFSVALADQPDEAQAIVALQRADVARFAFVEAYNDWAMNHDPYTISVADKKRFQKVRKTWKELDRLCRQIEY